MNLDSLIPGNHKVRYVSEFCRSIRFIIHKKRYKETPERPAYNMYDMFALIAFAAMENTLSVRIMNKAISPNVFETIKRIFERTECSNMESTSDCSKFYIIY